MPPGSVYGFLGPNGSGKTTTIRMLLGLAFPTSGQAELLGVPMPAGASRVLDRVGSLVEGPAFYPFLSGRDNLARYDAADRTADPRTQPARIAEALDRVGLLSAARKRYRNYSLGMKQRLAIAASLLRPRELIILDEPTNGLDPQGTREVRALVRQIAADGTTVFISSVNSPSKRPVSLRRIIRRAISRKGAGSPVLVAKPSSRKARIIAASFSVIIENMSSKRPSPKPSGSSFDKPKSISTIC